MVSLFLSYFLIYKYLVLFLVVATASFGVPIPATALLMAAWAFTAQGYLDIWITLFSSFAAAVFWDLLGFFIAFRHGKGVLGFLGFSRFIASPKFLVVENYFSKYSTLSIVLSRFLFTQLGPIINILSWLSQISWKKFLFYDLIGEAVYVILFIGLGYTFGEQWETILSISQDIALILILVLILIVLLVTVSLKRNKK